MPLPHEADVYRSAYANGARLRHVTAPLDEVMAAVDDEYPYHADVRLKLAAYVIGFSDGWHGAPPCH